MSLQAIGKFRCASLASSLLPVAALTLLILGTAPASVQADERSQAKRIHDRLTGVPASASELDALEQALVKDPMDAAYPGNGASQLL